MIPSKRSNKWIIVFVVYIIIILAGLIANRILLDTLSVREGIFRMFILALITAAPPCLAGYFDKRLFFYIYTVFVAIGIIYALYIAISDVAPGWGDLTSIISFLFIVLVGFAVSIITEAINYFAKRIRK